MLTRNRLVSLRFQVDDYEMLAGRIVANDRSVKEKTQAMEFLKTIPPAGGQSGHCALYWDELFEIGIGGLIEKLSVLLENSEGDRADTYQSFICALQGECRR